MRIRAFVLSLGCALLMALPAFSQGIPTGTLSGRVTSADGEALPGVLVTVSSPSLQGTRTATSNENGDYNLPLLPPGEYQVSFELEGFLSPQQAVKISAAQNTRVDADMAPSSVSEEIVVTGTYETISTTPQASSTYEKEFVEALPVERNLRETVLLTPGVAGTGPSANARNRAITIAGSLSYENLFLVNGVVVNENLRGQPHDLFIEDAIEETTTSVSGISAEFGRFSGGVVNAITKSGGNEVHGSFRTAFTNDSWEAKTPETEEQTDDINQRYEATLGGFLWKDRLWYFLAGRDFKQQETGQTLVIDRTQNTSQTFPDINDQQRYEGKLTFSPFQGHRLIGSYISIEEEQIGNRFGDIMDTRSLVDRTLPQELMALNYTGVITPNFFVEGQYSQREFTFEGSGATSRDRVFGTLLIDGVRGYRWWSPTFCGVCTDEERDNENIVAKGSWFLASETLGSHDVAFGYDRFNDIRLANNYQSGSDFRIIITQTLERNGELFPQMISGNNGTFIQWNPILVSSQGTDFVTNSYFLNDRWRLNNHWSFNLGARYDVNDGTDGQGKQVADDSRISPRLGIAYDPKGDGDWVVNLNYGHYVAALANNQADASSAGGNSATIQWAYTGPTINGPGTVNLIPTEQVINMIWEWFDATGGTSRPGTPRFVNLPGVTTVIEESLESPYTEEISLGVSKRLGRFGLFRTDYVRREARSFYSQRTDLSTGRVTALSPVGTTFTGNKTVLENSEDGIERLYDGLHTQLQLRLADRWNLGGTWTWSHARGNFDGETQANGPVAATVHNFPEYKDPRWNSPRGDLAIDQRHRARLWAVYDLFRTGHHSLQVGLLQNYFSGLPYGAVGTVDPKFNATTLPNGVQNPGYAIPPANVTYYFTAPDAYRTDEITATDLTLNYAFDWQALGREMEIFLQPEVLNVFNEHGAINVSSAINAATNTAGLRRFNPFTEQPVEGIHWSKPETFGKPREGNENDFQQPRTFRFSVGVRF